MAITVNALHKALGRLIDKGHGRAAVCIDKPTFRHNLESDGAVILDLSGWRTESVVMLNDDGGLLHNGRERYRSCVVLHGSSYEPSRGLED